MDRSGWEPSGSERPGTAPGWSASTWRYLTHPRVTWREALQGSVFLASSAVAAATVLASAKAVRRSRLRATA